MGQGEYSYAMRMRQVMQSLAESVVVRMRPAPRIGEVYDFNRASMTADVLFPGDTTPVRVKFYKGLQPRRKKMDAPTGDAPADVVRVEGTPGNYYITQVLNGVPFIEGGLPAGTILHGGYAVLPVGFLWATGGEYPKAEYPNLYASIGDLPVTAQGLAAPTSEDYFRVFDATDRFIVGAGAAKGLGTKGGSWTADIQLEHVPPHTHSIDHNHGRTAVDGSHSHDYSWREGATGGGPQNNIMGAGGTGGNVVTKRSAGPQGGDTHDHNVPALTGGFQSGSGSAGGLGQTDLPVTNKYLALNPIIKY